MSAATKKKAQTVGTSCERGTDSDDDRVVSLPVRNPEAVASALADLLLALLDSSGDKHK